MDLASVGDAERQRAIGTLVLAFGVDSALQAQGFGSELMKPCLEIVDRDHLPAYLDSTNPRNISFYQRHGFTVTGEWRAGACPPIISMLRDAH